MFNLQLIIESDNSNTEIVVCRNGFRSTEDAYNAVPDIVWEKVSPQTNQTVGLYISISNENKVVEERQQDVLFENGKMLFI